MAEGGDGSAPVAEPGGAEAVPDAAPLSSLGPAGSEPAPPVTASGNGAAAEAGSPGGAAASLEATSADVLRLKAVLDQKASSTADVLAALGSLKALGSLPTKVLGDTLIGKTVNQLAKNSGDEAVRTSAKGLVEDWRQMHRKRKSSASLGDSAEKPQLKRHSSAVSDKDGVGAEDSARGAPPPSLEKVNSTTSLGSIDQSLPDEPAKVDASEKKPLEQHRAKVLKMLVDALGKHENIETKGDDEDGADEERDPVVLAGEIESALNDAMSKKEQYLAQARTVLYNLKDAKNPTFRFKLVVGFFKPSDVPRLTAEDMASDEKNAERAAQRKYAMEAIQSDWAVRNGQQRICGMFTCGKCKGTRTTYFQMQTRSSDEPMTTFVTCLTCSNRWKFC